MVRSKTERDILHPSTGEEFIWEHNGRMDDPNYARKVLKRTAAYYRLGFHPGKNFIMTFEENNAGLDNEWIEAIIHQYFLDPISMKSKVRSSYATIT